MNLSLNRWHPFGKYKNFIFVSTKFYFLYFFNPRSNVPDLYTTAALFGNDQQTRRMSWNLSIKWCPFFFQSSRSSLFNSKDVKCVTCHI